VDLLGRDPLLGDTVLVEIKTGRGTRAPAEHNRQMQALALGLLEEGAEAIQAYLIECDWGRVTAAIFDDPKPLKSAVKALVLNATHATAQDLRAGSQCRYCTRREQCPVFADAPNQALEVLGERTLSPKDYAGSLSPEALGETLARVKPVVELAVSYLDALKARCYTLIEAGAEVPGWRVRLMGGARTWADEEAAARALQEAGFDLGTVMQLASPAQTEKRLGKSAREIVALHCVQGTRKTLEEVL
jgi:pyruvate/oxaloacetate carboxyltransferase